MRALVTGGAGFVGSALIRHLIFDTDYSVLNLDKLTYAGVPESLEEVAHNSRYRFVRGDVCDSELLGQLLEHFRPEVIVHLAAETHVDRSIDEPEQFVKTNIVGTYTLLNVALAYWQSLDLGGRARFRFHHVSTDEVFGSIGDNGLFDETTPYNPNSPYAASKAASDHLVRAWGRTYELPVLVTNCSNNYGPFQFPEKLVPLMIIKALAGERLPVYGDGRNVRDWLFVEDHARALRTVFERGVPGAKYNVGGDTLRRNLDVVHQVCTSLDRCAPRPDGRSYLDQIAFVSDRPGHDRRYATDSSKIRRELGWKPTVSFEDGIQSTVKWFHARRDWWQAIVAEGYDTRRLGLGKGMTPPAAIVTAGK